MQFRSRASIERFQDRSNNTTASLEIEMIRAKRYDRPLSIILFKGSSKDRPSLDQSAVRQMNIEKRLRKLGPDVLRLTDFWGPMKPHGFVMALTETPRTGAELVAKRVSEHPQFQPLVADFGGRSLLELGVAEFEKTFESLDEFIAAASANVVWSSETLNEPT